jgi:hypothetical protein
VAGRVVAERVVARRVVARRTLRVVGEGAVVGRRRLTLTLGLVVTGLDFRAAGPVVGAGGFHLTRIFRQSPGGTLILIAARYILSDSLAITLTGMMIRRSISFAMGPSLSRYSAPGQTARSRFFSANRCGAKRFSPCGNTSRIV